MQADSFSSDSSEADRGADGWLPLLHGALAALLIGLVGSFGTFQVWVLALSGALISHSIARRDGTEPDATDHTATLLKLAFVVVLCGAAFDNRVPRFDVLRPSSAGMFAFALIGAGLYLRHRAMVALGASFTIKVVVSSDHQLVDGGLYRVVRHPNYAGLVLVMIGTVVGLQSPLALAALAAFWLPALLLRIRAEESALGLQLGDAYRSYVARTWRLVPGLY
jgi:protein-S-isoprenylcysteine O-methyltransferase Ste14